jgi:pyruvate,water dikinase
MHCEMNDMHWIYLQDATDLSQLGGKARALATLARARVSIPAWFVLSPLALDFSLTEVQRQALAVAQDSCAAQTILAGAQFHPEIAAALSEAVCRLCGDGARMAVRSSAIDEDGAQHSFAGQLSSFLDVAAGDIAARVLDVWRSAFSARVYAYRREHSLSLPPPAPAVLIQRMVSADVAGVAFSADPVSGQRTIAVVSAVRGLGEALVSGEQDADSYYVAQSGDIVQRNLVAVEQPVLADGQVQAVAQLVRQVAQWFGRPQDIEWAIENGRLYLLQSRPITSLAQVADPDGVYQLWDNSNIVESYGGITTPLTYSFVRRAYEAVYQEFCRLMGVPQSIISANQPVFACMIGLIRGRIYYNLLNWYRVLAMLPGFKTNRQFMEQMMGVKESLPETIVNDLAQSTWRQRVMDRVYLMRTTGGLVVNYMMLNRRVRRFYARLHQALGAGRPDLTGWRADELVAYYRRLDRHLLLQWDAPLINDFFAMIFFGVLSKLVRQWCGDTLGALQNDLLAGEGGMISAEPAMRLQEMARVAAKKPLFAAALRTGAREAIERLLPEQPDFTRRYHDYLERFGDRCRDELKLESATLHDDPLPLLRAIGQLADHQASRPALGAANLAAMGGDKASGIRAQAEQRVHEALANFPLRRRIFWWVLRQARARVRDRENLRFTRTQVFGRARQIFVELGRRLYGAGALADAHDVFYLNMDEIFGFVEGATTFTDLSALAALRKAEFVGYQALPAPAERFATYGAVHEGNTFQDASAMQVLGSGDNERQGTGCCPGVVRGRVCVVLDPLSAALAPGDILVAERTDPSWILIMPAAAGLLMARGSLLSHTAIVARELGIPAIVGLTGVTQWLHDGDEIEFDGGTGVVRKMTG